jgi:8-oxo-dGTP pyrophosphatase MutT (NUDIX family)
MSIAPLRLAATVMMVRDDPFQVLMVKRNAREPFASALVFPGGVVEPEDFSEVWLPHLEGSESFTANGRALRVAACRESWEEVGLLPGCARPPMAREAAGDGSFLNHALRHGVRLMLHELTAFAHWITPEAAPKRFDTYFYICPIRHAEQARCDGRETVALEWVEPRAALEAEIRGARTLLLPTRENLKLLAQSEDSESAIAAARVRKIAPIMPGWVNGAPSLDPQMGGYNPASAREHE